MIPQTARAAHLLCQPQAGSRWTSSQGWGEREWCLLGHQIAAGSSNMNLAPLHCTQSSCRPTQAKALGQTLFVALSLPHHKTRRCASSVGPKDPLVSCLSGRNSEKETPVCVYLLIHYTCTLLIQYITLIRKHSPHFSTCKMRR